MYRNIPADLDEDTLKQLAAIGGGRYFAARNTRSMQEIFDQIDKLEKSKIEVTQFREYQDFFPWFVGASMVLLAAQMALSQSRWRRLP